MRLYGTEEVFFFVVEVNYYWEVQRFLSDSFFFLFLFLYLFIFSGLFCFYFFK